MNNESLEEIFDRALLRQNRARYVKDFSEFNFLHHEVANKIIESLDFIRRDFDVGLEIGARDGYLADSLKKSGKVKNIVKTEICSFGAENVIADDEHLPFKEDSFDLIVSALNFHYINQIPQFLLQVYKLLKKDGIFIVSFFGEENLSQLAHVIYESENELYNGMSPRMAPTIEVKTAAHLLQKAGFTNPISDFEKIEVDYSNPLNLLKDLKMMGQGNIIKKRSRKIFTKAFLDTILHKYLEKYPNDQGGVQATFEVVTATGWK